MIKAGQISKGMFLLLKEEPCLVVEREFVNPGKGQAFVRLRLKGLRTGRSIQQTFKTPDNVEDIHVDMRPAQYMYRDDESYHFMDNETFEQPGIPKSVVEDMAGFLKEGMEVKLTFYDGEPIDLELPTSVDLKVVQAEIAVKGDTATGVTKKVVTETGQEVQVPYFVVTGDTIRVDTRTGAYVTRV